MRSKDPVALKALTEDEMEKVIRNFLDRYASKIRRLICIPFNEIEERHQISEKKNSPDQFLKNWRAKTKQSVEEIERIIKGAKSFLDE